jgi:hypothetical protein
MRDKKFLFPCRDKSSIAEEELLNHFNIVSEEQMAASIPRSVMERYLKLEQPFSKSEWYIDSLSVKESALCAFEPYFLHFDCHCFFSFCFVRQTDRFEFRVLKIIEWGWSKDDRCFYRDDFQDDDFEAVWNCINSDVFWDMMYKGSQMEVLRPVTGDLIETRDVNILDLCRNAFHNMRL